MDFNGLVPFSGAVGSDTTASPRKEFSEGCCKENNPIVIKRITSKTKRFLFNKFTPDL